MSEFSINVKDEETEVPIVGITFTLGDGEETYHLTTDANGDASDTVEDGSYTLMRVTYDRRYRKYKETVVVDGTTHIDITLKRMVACGGSY